MSAVSSGELRVKDNSNATLIVMELIDGDKGYACGPERALMSAILFDGVQAYLNYASAESVEIRDKFKEAYAWVNSLESEYVFAFDNVCEALGINPDFLRYGLANVCNSLGSERKQMRRKF